MSKKYKFKSADFNNRKKQLHLSYSNGKSTSISYGSLGIGKNIKKVWIDKETSGQSVGIEFLDGSTDYLPYDQPLFIAKDPEYLLQIQIELLIAEITAAIKSKKISKRYLAEKLNTSDNQVQRLLNPRILNKNLAQLYKIASLLNLEIYMSVKEVA
jgi:hypothetical protein